MIFTIGLTLFYLLYFRRFLESFRYGLLSMLLLLFYDAFYYNPDPSFLTVGSLRVFPGDISFCFFFVFSYLRISKKYNLTSISREAKQLLWVYGYAILCIPVFILFFDARLVQTINTSRVYILFLPIGLYFYTFKYNQETKKELDDYLFWFLVISACYTVFLFLQQGLSTRVIGSPGSLVLLYGFVFSLVNYIQHKEKKYLILAVSLFMLVVILRHRSVWIGLAFGMLYLLYYIGIKPIMIRIILLTSIMVIPLFFLPDKITSKVKKMLVLSAVDLSSRENFENSTGGGRVSRWKAIFKKEFDTSVIFIGKGHAYDRNVKFRRHGGAVIATSSVSFHNNYLEHLFRMGGISLLFLLLALFRMLWRIHDKFRRQEGFQYLFLGATIMVTLAYGMAYSYYWFFMVFLGIGLSMLDENTTAEP